jgi:hypothetical protein
MARNFNGTSDFIDCGTNSSLNITGNFTVAGWANPASVGGGIRKIIAAKDDNISGRNFYLAIAGAITEFGTDAVPAINGSATLSVNAWVHIAAVYLSGAGTGTIYLNGAVDVGPSPVGTAATDTASFTIGERTYAANNNFFNGLLADVAIWNTNLSSLQIAQLANGYRPVDVNSANLKGWWPLSGYSSPEPDLSGNANNGTLTGTSAAPMPPSLGRGGRHFGGADKIENTSSPSTATIGSWSAITIAAWAYYDPSQGTNGCVLSLGRDNLWQNFGVGLRGTAGGNSFACGLRTNAGTLLSASFSMNIGSWYHLAVTGSIAGATGIPYLNGIAQTTFSLAGSSAFVGLNNGYLLGQDTSGGMDPLTGGIADAAIWNTQLSAGQIAALAASTRPPNVNSANLQLWLPLDSFSNATENDKSANGFNGTLTATSPILGPPQLWRLG